MRLLPCGDRALLVEVASLEAVLAVDARLRSALTEGPLADLVVDIVPAARTVLVTTERPRDLPALRGQLERALADDPGEAGPSPSETVEIAVVYDGEDLADVATITGLGEREVVAAHTGQAWRVAFGGFSPGFAYLVGGDPRLHVPRRDDPRTRVPAGAVGLAGEFSGIYPTASPGGWQLIGRTDAVLWDVDRDPPALLRPGVEVRFVEARGR